MDKTARFLERMEAQRLRKPCPRALDMRGKVPGECKPYEHQGRQFWLDDISYAIFARGLEKNGGVFTVGTYEAIVNGPHTNRAIRESEAVRQAEEGTEEAEGEAADAETAPSGNDRRPEVYQFGYFKRRTEERLQFATRVDVQRGDYRYSGKTRNLSAHGLALYLNGRYRFETGEQVTLSFPDLQPAAADRVQLAGIRYTVMFTRQIGAVHTLRLKLDIEVADPRLVGFFQHFVEAYRKRNRLDVDDEFRAVATRLYERMYVENTVQLPLFVAKGRHGLTARAVAVGKGNEHLSTFFNEGGRRYDFSALALPQRLEWLHEQGELIVCSFRDERNRILSAADAEFDDPEEFLRFAAHALQRPHHLCVQLALGCRGVRMPTAQRFEPLSKRLGDRWPAALAALKGYFSGLRFVAAVTEVTDVMRTLVGRCTPYLEQAPPMDGLTAWHRHERIGVPNGEPLEQLDPAAVGALQVADFGYLRPRREERYRASTAVLLELGRKKLDCQSRDISVRGLCVELKAESGLQVGEDVTVGYPSLQKKKPSLNLMRVHYRVVKKISGDENLLMLERVREDPRERDRRSDPLDDFFQELIDTNRGKLDMDEADIADVVAAHAWEAVAVENLGTLPVFFGRGDRGLKVHSAAVQIDPCCPIIDFFRDEDGDYDFSPLNESRIALSVRELFLPLQRAGNVRRRRPLPLQLEIYLYRAWDAEANRPVVHCADSVALSTPFERGQFIRRAMDHGEYRFLQLTGTYVQPLEARFHEEALRRIHSQANFRGLQLDDLLHAVEGCGDLVDITEELSAAYRASDAAER